MRLTFLQLSGFDLTNDARATEGQEGQKFGEGYLS